MVSPLFLAFGDSNILQRYISRDTGDARRRAAPCLRAAGAKRMSRTATEKL
jgi:hypothetical protein